MKSGKLFLLFFLHLFSMAVAQPSVSDFPVRGMTISAPKAENVDQFVDFIDHHLSKTDVNFLVLMINYKYEFKSHPELAEKGALSLQQVKKLLQACRRNNIELVPLVNLLGHQSWKKDNINALLTAYPQFEENPGDKLASTDFYCRSYCPLHPDVHKVVFEVLDEIVEAFESKSLHVGMDEVFVLGEEGCPRCKGKNKAVLFAGEVNKIHDHLAKKNLKMYMWGDRLIDGETTGLGIWQASGTIHILP